MSLIAIARLTPFILVVALTACVHRPVEDLVLADVAVKAAQKVKADALAPDAYRKAENYYLRAKKDFAEGYFDSSRRYARDARLLAEQAEFKALVKQNQQKTRPIDDEPSSPREGDSSNSNSNPPAPTEGPAP